MFWKYFYVYCQKSEGAKEIFLSISVLEFRAIWVQITWQNPLYLRKSQLLCRQFGALIPNKLKLFLQWFYISIIKRWTEAN